MKLENLILGNFDLKRWKNFKFEFPTHWLFLTSGLVSQSRLNELPNVRIVFIFETEEIRFKSDDVRFKINILVLICAQSTPRLTVKMLKPTRDGNKIVVLHFYHDVVVFVVVVVVVVVSVVFVIV